MKNKYTREEFITSSISTLLLLLIALLQYRKGRGLWRLILIAALSMGLSSYSSYRKLKED